MKTFIKTLVCLSILIAGSKVADAQLRPNSKGVIYSVGLESGLSSGNFNNAYRWNIGGSLQADIPVYKSLFIPVNAGYLNFNGKDNLNGGKVSAPNIRLLPVTTGLKYFPFSYWYVQGTAGVGFALNKNDLNYNKSAAFIYAPQVGTLLNVGGRNFIDVSVRYQGTSKFTSSIENSKINFFELRVAYAFR